MYPEFWGTFSERQNDPSVLFNKGFSSYSFEKVIPSDIVLNNGICLPGIKTSASDAILVKTSKISEECPNWHHHFSITTDVRFEEDGIGPRSLFTLADSTEEGQRSKNFMFRIKNGETTYFEAFWRVADGNQTILNGISETIDKSFVTPSHLAILVDISPNGAYLTLYVNGELWYKNEEPINQGKQFISSENCDLYLPNYEESGPNEDITYFSNFKFYPEIISKKRILLDYQCLCAHYLFDGSCISDEESYLTESDVSGYENDIIAQVYELGLPSDAPEPLVLTLTGNVVRDYSVSIPEHDQLLIPVRPDIFFINFWVYIVNNGKSGIILSSILSEPKSVQVATNPLGDGTYRIRVSAGDGFYQQMIELSTWYMISLSYQGDGKLTVYINGKKKGEIDCDSISTVNFGRKIYQGGYFRLESFPGVISDFRFCVHSPTDSEIVQYYEGFVVVDGKGTIYSPRIEENPDINGPGFGVGKLCVPSFDQIDFDDRMTIAEYDPSEKIFHIRDYEEM